jgi:hypothetical protein
MICCSMLFVGLAFTGLLDFAKCVRRPANRFLALALLMTIVWITRLLTLAIRLPDFFPNTVLFIAVLTVSVQAVKAAIANPVKSLRSE